MSFSVCFTMNMMPTDFFIFIFINSRHPNIRFTIERDTVHRLPFLNIYNKYPPAITTIYCKKAFTGLLINYFSFTPRPYKTWFRKNFSRQSL